MDDQRRRDAATTTFGMAGVGGGAALRHVGLERAYHKGKRPPVLQELKMLKEGTKGRRFYGAGMLLAGASAPAAVVGGDRLLTSRPKTLVKKSKKKERRSFAAEGVSGMKRSFVNGNQTIKHPPPAKLMAGNYIGGGILASSAGGLANMALKRHTKIPGAGRAALAAMTATGVGTASLPAQSKIMNRASHGEYEATAYGVRRTKTKPVRPSARATQVEARASRGADMRRARQEIVGKAARLPVRVKLVPLAHAKAVTTSHHWANGRPVVKVVLGKAYIQRSLRKIPRSKLIETHRAAMWEEQTRGQSSLAQAHQQFIRELKELKAAPTPKVRSRPRFGVVTKYYGEDMTHAQKRRRVAAVTGVPFVADLAQAGQAGRMAPPELRKRTAALTYGAGQTGGVTGSIAGAYGAAALARRSKTFTAGTYKVNDTLDAGKAKVRSVVHLKPKTPKPGLLERTATNTKAPALLRRAAKPLIGHGKAAAVGSLALGALGGQAGSQTGYGAALRMEDKLKAKRSTGNQGARHGTRVAKRDVVLGQTKRQQAKLRRQKEQSAGLSLASGVTGLAALGATAGSKIPHVSPKVRGRLGKVPLPMLTIGGGIGGINAFKYADIQHKEASAKVKKAYLAPTGKVVRRAPTMRTGFLRQTRTNTGIKTSTVRGSLG